MSLFSEYVERVQNGAQLTNTIHMRPMAVRQSGVLLAMIQDFADGDATFPQIVNRAPLRVRTKNDGTRRLLPIPGDDTKWLELGAPFVQVGGTWTQVSLGTPSRTGHTLTWTRPQTITTVTHGGHFVDLEIELRNGFVPENSRIAFPVGMAGLSRSGVEIKDGDTVVARLRPFAMIDAADSLAAPRPISHQFTSLAGQPYLLLTLPDLTGMVRPVIDPTLELQPDATAGKDTFIRQEGATTNFGTSGALYIGEYNAGDELDRALIQFDLTTLPDAAVISAATLTLRIGEDYSSNARTVRVFRLKRAWVETQATWNIYSTGNNWSTAGGFHTDDCEQTDIGSVALTATEFLDFKDFTLTPTTKTALDLGNGWLIKSDGESNDLYGYVSSDAATAGNRPKLAVTYTEAAAAAQFFVRSPMWGRF